MAKKLLTQKNIEFTEVNIEETPEARMYLLEEGHRTMPQIYQGTELYVEGGFEGLRAKLEKDDINLSDMEI
jgi:glutaredoxin